jgi:hypothetical protein
MDEFFGADVDNESFARTTIWEMVKSHAAIEHNIPLPPTNTPFAKRMRVAAGVIIYGRALDKYIFKPNYLTRDSEELNKVLEGVRTNNPLQETFVRGVLLRVLPDTQRRNKDTRVRLVVSDVVHSMGILLSKERKDKFESELNSVSDRICLKWETIQRLEEKVKSSFSYDYPDEWRQFPESVAKHAQSRPSSPLTQKSSLERLRKQDQASSRSLTGEGYTKVVWPGFLFSNAHEVDEELLHQGYVVTISPEENAEDGIRRAARKTARLNDKSGPKKRRDSGIFPSVGTLDGSAAG